MSRKVTRRKVLGGILGLGALGAVHELAFPTPVRLEQKTLALPRWSADGFRAGLLTDIHVNSDWEADNAIGATQMLAEQKPDCLLLAGDLTDRHDDSAGEHLQRALDAIGGTGIPAFAVLGNHDYDRAQPELVMERCRKAGIALLRNEAVPFQGITIAGIDDGVHKMDRHDFLTSTHDRNTLAIFHEPDFVERIDPRISVMLAGHSHGGQVCLPGGRHLFTPYGAKQYIKGWYADAKVPLYVSRGAGTGGADVRVFCPPEASILTLVSA